jgi:membrane protein implicated in regulation of membrane protease activity
MASMFWLSLAVVLVAILFLLATLWLVVVLAMARLTFDEVRFSAAGISEA